MEHFVFDECSIDHLWIPSKHSSDSTLALFNGVAVALLELAALFVQNLRLLVVLVGLKLVLLIRVLLDEE